MKKIVLSIVTLMFALVAVAQNIESKKEGDYYYLVSPNARYYAGSQQGNSAYRYDLETKVVDYLMPEGENGFKTNMISNDGVIAGAYEWKAALWLEGEDVEYLPLPEGLTALEEATNDAVAITPDGKHIVVSFNADAPKTYYVYTKKEDGIYDMTILPMPEKDPIYSMYPQWIGVKDISADGNTLIGLFLTEDGQRQLPLMWKNVDGVWSYEFFGLDICLKKGATIPPFPYDQMVEDPSTGELALPFNVWDEWTTAQYEAETGKYYQLKGASMSGSGMYVSFNVAIQPEGEPYATMYGAVYDVDKKKVIIFDSLENATALSVNNIGEVIVATPATEEFRWSHVVSVRKPKQPQTLTEWMKKQTSGMLDLADYMVYDLPEGTTVAEGTAYWAEEGRGLVTYQMNMFSTGKYESYFITFDEYLLPEKYAETTMVDVEVETFYSGKQTLTMAKEADGTLVLVNPENCAYTLFGNVTSDYTQRDITSNEMLAAHTASFIRNAVPVSDADGDWDFFELKQVGVLGFDATDSIDLDTCRFNYIFWLEKDGQYLHSNQTYGEDALTDTVPPVELIMNYKLERDSTYRLKVLHRTFGWKETVLCEFDFVASESGRFEFPDSTGVDGYFELSRIPNHALDVHYVMSKTNVYYNEVHGRNSFDDKGSPVYSFVDMNDPVWYGEWQANAAASGAAPYFVAVGCGSKWTSDTENFSSFDLLAHEYAHLVVSTNGRGGMEPVGESGALNEAIADCMSVATDFYTNGDRANWQIADGVTNKGIPNMRDLSNPKMSGGGIFSGATLSYPQPDTYKGENWVDPKNMNYDNGGIHFNNGVFNYWFYLLTEGGNGVNDNEQEYEVTGIGMQKTEVLLMHIILNYLEPTMTFVQMRAASQLATVDLWGEESEEMKQVKNAWYAVGVAENSEETSVDNVEQLTSFNVYSNKGNIVVDAEANSIIDVYSVLGQHLTSVKAQSGFTTIPVEVGNNVVIVKVGNAVQKVVVK